MKQNIKYVAINADTKEGKQILESSKKAVYELDPELFTFGGAGFQDYLKADFAGELADDPIFFYNKKDGKKLTKQNVDPVFDDACYAQINVISTVKAYYDANGEFHKRSSRYRLVLKDTAAKKSVSRLHKGDRVSGSGTIISFSQRNPNNPSKGMGFWYIEVDSITVNPYKTISRGAQEAFAEASQIKHQYKDANEIMADYTLSKEEKYELLSQLYDSKNENQSEQVVQQSKSIISSEPIDPDYPAPENPQNHFVGFENKNQPKEETIVSNDTLKKVFNNSL